MSEQIGFEGRIAEVIEQAGLEGAAARWRPCSGCYEIEDGRPAGKYPHSKMLECDVGAGCHECGGLGAVWEYHSARDLEDMAKQLDELEPDARGESVLRALEPFARAAGFHEVQTCADDQMFLVKKGKGFSGALTARDFRRAYDVLAMLRSGAPSEVRSTPSARWRSDAHVDPHRDKYNCERAALTNGDMTDDQLANEVFLHPSIANLTAAKDRIRWLSRKLEEATSSEIATQLRCAENEIERIEALVPDWRAFRDLPEAVEVTLHALRSELARIGGPK